MGRGKVYFNLLMKTTKTTYMGTVFFPLSKEFIIGNITYKVQGTKPVLDQYTTWKEFHYSVVIASSVAWPLSFEL